MVKNDIKQELKDITKVNRNRVTRANAGLMKDTIENILEEAKDSAKGGSNELGYIIKEYALKDSKTHTKTELLDYFGKGLCRKLRDRGLRARFEHKYHREKSGGSMGDDCNPFGSGGSSISLSFNYIRVKVRW